MQERTRAYLRGRFRDFYRRNDRSLPPDADAREWGYVPWSAGPGTTMIRHNALLDLGDFGDFLERERPQHVYFSVGRYDDPSADSMGEKNWRGSDLVFDLDADHLPAVTLGKDSYAEMLEKCKAALVRLLSFLEGDFGFRDMEIVFSGGRGYHVHVRDRSVQDLERGARREIVDYVRGTGLRFEALVAGEEVAGTAGRTSPARKRTFSTTAGWSARAHRHLLALVDDLLATDEDEALSRLQEIEGIGKGRSEAILRVARENYGELERGNVDVHPAVFGLARQVAGEVAERDGAPIDEPVTTDVNRLIRLPGSLHGGSGLAVRRIDREAVAEFDPLSDAIPETFRGQEITIDVTDPGPVELGGDSFILDNGNSTVSEYVGVFLMARGRAEKERER
ncbi:DNA primase catalytic subunit PriS [Halobacteriales archaeon QS_8_65_32]|jgi:DNA primase small subunit|nr:MAG: DNA primase catalytic subunit PriS [Halobacteriales archaeon QS_8_65_32]